jgi:predicted MPP superfamily phosphohydrolase
LEREAVNWSWFFLRIAIVASLSALLFLSQRFWYRSIWKMTGNWETLWLRILTRVAYASLLVLIIVSTADGFRMGHRGHLIPNDNLVTVFAGLWFSSALFAYVAVKLVRVLERVWTLLRRTVFSRSISATANSGTTAQGEEDQLSPTRALPETPAAAAETVPDPSRRYFFRTASALAGATPFLSAVYGFAAERLNYQVRRVDIPLANLPAGLEGMKIVQISDIHLSGYMDRTDVRRAVEMANDLGADLAVVTGDFITSASDPLADCIDEIKRLRSPLGVWGCNGNHEIYARAEDAAQSLFADAGMKLLRHENAQLTFRGAQFNLLGVDYQRERSYGGQRLLMLDGLAPLVRRDMPNILLSHNPNSFNRAAELGIELSLAGHTHGGQIQVEILDHRLSPARFITDYIAGTYYRPLAMPAQNKRALRGVDKFVSNEMPVSSHAQPPLSVLYVNRGLGTVGAPVRLGVPPEITLFTLRRA